MPIEGGPDAPVVIKPLPQKAIEPVVEPVLKPVMPIEGGPDAPVVVKPLKSVEPALKPPLEGGPEVVIKPIAKPASAGGADVVVPQGQRRHTLRPARAASACRKRIHGHDSCVNVVSSLQNMFSKLFKEKRCQPTYTKQ